MKISIEEIDIKEPRKADARGRVALGPEYADKKVRVIVVEAEDV